MKSLDKTKSELILTLSTTQPIGRRRRFADLVIGGLLVVFAIGGFAM